MFIHKTGEEKGVTDGIIGVLLGGGVKAEITRTLLEILWLLVTPLISGIASLP